MYSSKYLEQLIEELVKLPSVGQKSAQRLALHLMRVPREEAIRLAEAIRDAREKVGFCSVCGLFSEEDPCPIDRDPQRDARVICVVEQPADVLALERTGSFRGRYHVLGGALSPLEGTQPEDLRIRELLAPLGVRVTRIARGVPMGSDLEYSDQVTLARALEGRREIE